MRDLLDRLRNSSNVVLGSLLLVVVVLAAILVPLVSPYHPEMNDIPERLQGPNPQYPLGTDSFGRDVLTRIGWGIRSSLAIALAAVGLGAFTGSVIGLASGMAGRTVDSALMGVINVIIALPALLLALLIASLLGAGVTSIVIAIASSNVAIFARLVRGEALRIRAEPFIEAARSTGAAVLRIAIRHVVPNLLAVLIVAMTLRVSTAILTEAVLSYLGLGISPPTPTLGNMILEGQRNIQIALWISLGPGVTIMLAVLGINLVGDGLRDVLDPRTRRETPAPAA